MKNALNLVCAVVMMVACGTALADVRCWTEPDGFEECVYDENYNRYGAIKDDVQNVDMSKFYDDDKDLEKIFGRSGLSKIRSAATREGKTVKDYIADKLSSDRK